MVWKWFCTPFKWTAVIPPKPSAGFNLPHFQTPKSHPVALCLNSSLPSLLYPSSPPLRSCFHFSPPKLRCLRWFKLPLPDQCDIIVFRTLPLPSLRACFPHWEAAGCGHIWSPPFASICSYFWMSISHFSLLPDCSYLYTAFSSIDWWAMAPFHSLKERTFVTCTYMLSLFNIWRIPFSCSNCSLYPHKCFNISTSFTGLRTFRFSSDSLILSSTSTNCNRASLLRSRHIPSRLTFTTSFSFQLKSHYSLLHFLFPYRLPVVLHLSLRDQNTWAPHTCLCAHGEAWLAHTGKAVLQLFIASFLDLFCLMLKLFC